MPLLALLAGCEDPRPQAEELSDVPEWAESPIREDALGDEPLRLDTLTASRLSGAFRAAADRALPSVVYIQVETAANPTQPMFRFFGGDEMPNEEGSGSGFIFDARGYILTNNHVVQGASSLAVRLVDGREYPATIVGADPNSDVAVIKIEAREGETLPVAQLGSSNELRVGDWVLALGSPFSLDFSVTAGIVSAKGRNRIIDSDGMELEAFIQTDAAINPGNSGGPLVDLLGRVVGVNTAIYSPSGVYAGYGFAIPVSIADRVARDLVRYGVVHRPQLGVQVADVTADDADYYELTRVAGALVKTVADGSPADNAGLRVGDVILGVDSSAVTDATQLIATLAQREPGESIDVVFMRSGRPLRVSVELSEFKTGERVASPPREPVARSSRPDFTVVPLDSRYAREVGYDGDGVIVRSVTAGSVAEQRGLIPGMILTALNEQPVEDVQDLERALGRLERGEVVSLRVYDPSEDMRTETVINYRPR
ncbi:MAG TPA: trypsin-like peptidase domain-containing protein [Thermoanaerobaculia bacterium]